MIIITDSGLLPNVNIDEIWRRYNEFIPDARIKTKIRESGLIKINLISIFATDLQILT